MNENKKYYFSIIKLCSIIILMMYYVFNSQEPLHKISMEWFLLAVLLASAIGYELTGLNKEHSKLDDNHTRKAKSFFISDAKTHILLYKKLLFLCMEIGLTIIFILINKNTVSGIILLPMVALDAIVYFQCSFAYSISIFTGALLIPDEIPTYLVYCVFLIIIYYQNYMVIEKYHKYLDDFEAEEYRLKDSIHEQDTKYKEELEKSSLTYENNMLEEKARLSQTLHDKLGHSINGSIYQLEACKVLMEKEPDESKKIIQAVIDNLRTSMDEIRGILKREKPNKKQMAFLQLHRLSEECKVKYAISVELKINGEQKDNWQDHSYMIGNEISDFIWDVILDNTMEAVTNALKYSKCTKIVIEITVLHKIIRCTITDNGIGCYSIREGMGIQGMKNRVRKINGFLDMNGDNGFRINMIIPKS